MGKHVQILTEYVAFMHHLRFLNLSFNAIDDECTMNLCTMIQRQTNNLYKKWHGCVINGMMDILEIKNVHFIQDIVNIVQIFCGIKQNEMMDDLGLIGLDLRSNDITNIGATRLYKNIEKNMGKERNFELNLAGNLMTSDIYKIMMMKRKNL